MVYFQDARFKVICGTTAHPNLQLPDEIKELIDDNPLNDNNEAQIYVCGGWIYIIIPASGELCKNGGAWSMDFDRLETNMERRWLEWGINGGKVVIAIRVLFPYETEQIIKGWLARDEQLGRANNGTSELFNFLGRLNIVIKLLKAVLRFADTGMIFGEMPGEDSGNLDEYRQGTLDKVEFKYSSAVILTSLVRFDLNS